MKQMVLLLQAPPKQQPKTIENLRVKDETMVNAGDDEVSVQSLVSLKVLCMIVLLKYLFICI